jgi:putative (di)nucleoside polyphosphate hydrolase
MELGIIPVAEPDPAYRRGVGLMLLDSENRVFVARRIDTREAAWQMPQGGIDAGETPEQAALRELEEEIGTAAAEILFESRGWYSYDLPIELSGSLWRGRYRGQSQKWFALRFTGREADIDLATAHPEFDAWRWAKLDELTGLIVSWKRPLYAAVVAEFSERLAAETR